MHLNEQADRSLSVGILGLVHLEMQSPLEHLLARATLLKVPNLAGALETGATNAHPGMSFTSCRHPARSIC